MEKKSNIPTSMFYMWRCIIALAHADGILAGKEVDYLSRIFTSLDKTYGLTDMQKEIFSDDLATPQKIDALLPHVTDPEFRTMLISYGETLAWADGNLSPGEDALLRRLGVRQMAPGEIEKLRGEIRLQLATRRTESDSEKESLRAQVHSQSPKMAALDNFLRKNFKIDVVAG